MSAPALYGLLAEFPSADSLCAAARHVRERGYTRVEAYSPFAIEGLDEIVGADKGWIAPLTLLGGLLGGAGTYFLQWYTAVVDYPIEIGGRPLHSWPAFIPVTFECTILVAALSAVLGMLALNGLPMPYHPVFNVPRFALASRNRFFLCIEGTDPKFDPQETRSFLEQLTSREVTTVAE